MRAENTQTHADKKAEESAWNVCTLENEINHPGLKSHPQHELAKKQMTGFSGMIGVILKGDQERVDRFLTRLKIFTLAESMGGVESLVNHPLTMTHASVPDPLRQKLGITYNLIRISVGIKNADDLINDIAQTTKLGE